MTLKIFIENHFYSLLVFVLVLINAMLVLGIINIRIYCCKYCKLSDNGRRVAQLQTNRCELFVHQQLENANHQPLRLVQRRRISAVYLKTPRDFQVKPYLSFKPNFCAYFKLKSSTCCYLPNKILKTKYSMSF